MKKKSNKLNLIICAIAFVFMIFYVYFVDGFDNLINSIQKINVGALLLAVLLMVIYWAFEAIGVHASLRTTYPQAKFSRTFMVAMLGQYFNCITPSSTGGQPMQVYYFTKFGVPMSHAMTALLSKFIMYQFVLTGYSAVILFARFSTFSSDYAPLMALVVFGFIINTIVIILLFMLAFFKKPVKKLAVWAVKLISKIHIFKLRFIKSEEDKQAKIEAVEKIIDEYHDNFVFIKKKPLLIIRLIIYNIIQLTAYFSISFIIYIGFGLSGTDYFTIISCQAFVLMISAFMPLPGALGAAEGSYTLFFSKIFVDGEGNKFVGISTFIWRFLTFYLPIIVGLILSLFVGKFMNVSVPDKSTLALTEEEMKESSIE